MGNPNNINLRDLMILIADPSPESLHAHAGDIARLRRQ